MGESDRDPNKPDRLRRAISEGLAAERRRALGEQIVDGYCRIPQTDEEVGAATEAAIRSIEEEPW